MSTLLGSIFSGGTSTRTPFRIYENEYLLSNQDEVAQQQYLAVQFDAMMDFAFKNSVNVASEPLENMQFSSDNIQTNPYDLFVTGAMSKIITRNTNTTQDILNTQSIVESQLSEYLDSTTLLCVVQHPPLFRIYPNLKLLTIAYDFTADKQNLIVFMTFKQIRQTTADYGALQPSQLSNPTNASTVSNGNVSPQSATAPNAANLGTGGT